MQLCGSLNFLWNFLSLELEWKHLFQSCGHCWVFQICWLIEGSTFTESSFTIWNSSTGIPSPPPALFLVMLPTWLHIPGCLALGEWSHHRDYLGHEDLFLYSSSLVAQMVKHLPAMRETRIWSLGWEDLLEKETATHSNTLAWRIPQTEEPDRLQSTDYSPQGRRELDTTERLHFLSLSLSVYSCHLFLITS